MATERKDGTFTETKELQEALGDFLGEIDKGEARSFHVGTEQEIEDIKNQLSIEERLTSLEAKIRPSSDVLDIPSKEIIRHFKKNV